MKMITKTINFYDIMYYDVHKELFVERIAADKPATAAAILKNKHPGEAIEIYDIHIAEGDFKDVGKE